MHMSLPSTCTGGQKLSHLLLAAPEHCATNLDIAENFLSAATIGFLQKYARNHGKNLVTADIP